MTQNAFAESGTSPTRSEHSAELTLPETLEHTHHALTANELAAILGVSPKTLFKKAKAHTVPCFRVGTCVRFDPVSVARWLRTQ